MSVVGKVFCNTHTHTHTYTPTPLSPLIQYAPKKLPLPFDETERNRPFNETERAVHDPFEVRAYLPSVLNVLIKYYYIRIAQSALARGSL